MSSVSASNRPTTRPGPRRRAGFTYPELLLAVLVLAMLGSLMIGLSTDVRLRSGQQITRRALGEVQVLVTLYEQVHGGSPDLPWVEPDGTGAAAHNEQLVAALRSVVPGQAAERPLIANLSPAMDDGKLLRDAWGTPIVLPGPEMPELGLVPGGRPIAVSAGPDRDFRAAGDNVYSPAFSPSTTPAPAVGTGQDE